MTSINEGEQYWHKKAVLERMTQRHHEMQEESQILLDCARRELLSLKQHGWQTSQPGLHFLLFVFPTEEQHLAKIQELEEAIVRLQSEVAAHKLAIQLAGRESYFMSLCGPPGPKGVEGTIQIPPIPCEHSPVGGNDLIWCHKCGEDLGRPNEVLR